VTRSGCRYFSHFRVVSISYCSATQ